MKQLLYLGNKLVQNGANPTTIDTLGPLLEKEGFKISYASTKSNKVARLLDMIRATCFTRKLDYVLIDTYSTTNFWYAFVVSRICYMRNLRYIPILHGGNLPQRWLTNPKSCKLLFHQAYRNVCPSPYLLQVFEELKCPNLVHIPNTLGTRNYTFKERIAIQPKLLWVRAFAELYNPIMAVNVFAQLVEEFPESELCMVGPDKDGSLKKTEQLARKLGLNVTFPGQLSKSEWIQLSEQYDIFINTTHFDNMPVSVIEAMSLGLAVVSTRVGGIPFLIEDSEEGLLVGDNEIQAMCDAIQFLLRNPSEFSRITKKARAKAAFFEWEWIKEKWVTILDNPC
nr:glycosyltransferase family 4 protein [uncultured Flavobacterium sp.]